jgi:hypothetical protein
MGGISSTKMAAIAVSSRKKVSELCLAIQLVDPHVKLVSRTAIGVSGDSGSGSRVSAAAGTAGTCTREQQW